VSSFGACGVLAVILLTGCGAGIQPDAAPSQSPSECVVPANPNGEPPEGCTTYDPEANMAANEAYRDRLEIGADALEAGAPYVESATAGLTALQGTGAITAEAVREVLHDSGLEASAIQTIGDANAVEFGGMLPAEVGGPGVGVCLFGDVSADRVAVDVGGVSADGGCLTGHGGH
jgi:hypothetical protein